MGNIVFSTIKENISSFFGKEEELMHESKGVPEAASEVFEHPQPKKIVDKPLPDHPVVKPKKELPFSPDQLRTALKNKPQEKPKPSPPAEEPETHELHDFETVLQDVHEVHREEPKAVARPEPQERPPLQEIPDSREGFFDEFGRFLMQDNYATDGVMDMDIVHRMREFHKHQQEGKEYYVYSKDVQIAIERKLSELKTLEREWFHTRQQLDELERGLSTVEAEVESRSSELKTLLHQAQKKSRLEHKAKLGGEFSLYDGRKLSSLLDLKIALHTMTDEVFRHHVNERRNDFASWIKNSLGQEDVAAGLRDVRDKHAMKIYLGRLAG